MAAFPSNQRFSSPRNTDFANSALADSAFEPQSGFIFEDAADDEEFRNMQRNISFLDVQQTFDPRIGVNGGMVPPGFANPFMFDHGDLSSNSRTWPMGQGPGDCQPQSTQADIVNSRSGASHHFGQVTPPDDSTPKHSSDEQQPFGSTPPAQAAINAKSERARNAANQRHAKSKKARKDSVRNIDSADEDLVDDKREKYREKNRLAAAKCRAKKKNNTDDLELTARAITAENTKLRAEERELRDLFSSLRHQALAHDATQGCNCQAIHLYNANKAQEAARGAANYVHGRGIPSPSASSIISAAVSPTIGSASVRAQSFSGAKPLLLNKHSARAHSIASPMSYLTQADMMQQITSTNRSTYDFATANAGEDSGFPGYLQRSSEGQQSELKQ